MRVHFTEGESVFVTVAVDSHLVRDPKSLHRALHWELEQGINELLEEVQRDQTTTAEANEEAHEAGNSARIDLVEEDPHR